MADRPRRFSPTAFNFLLAVLLLAVYFASVFLAVVFFEDLNLVFLVGYGLGTVLSLCLAYVICRQLRHSLSFRRLRWRDVGLALLVQFLTLLLTVLVRYALAALTDSPLTAQISPLPFDLNDLNFLIVAGVIVLLVPLYEEIVFRGILYQRLRRYWSFMAAALMSSVFFALLHIRPSADWEQNLSIVLSIFVFSLAISYVFDKTRNLWMPVFMHVVNNGLVILAVLVIMESNGGLI